MKPASLTTTLDVAEWALRAYRNLTERVISDDLFAQGVDAGERAAYYNLLVGILGTPDSSQPDQIIDIFTDRLRDGQRQAGQTHANLGQGGIGAV